MRAHNKQFLIGNQQIQIQHDWKTKVIGENLYLSHCSSLIVQSVKDLSGVEWHILGIAVQSDNTRESPLTEIARSHTNGIKKLYSSWAGRWVLVGNHQVHTDCSSLLGCFYTKITGDHWVSSSLAIIEEICGLSPRPEILKHKVGIEWYPLPLTRFEGVFKILPSQFLNLTTFIPEPRPLPHEIKGKNYNEILTQIAEKLKHSLVNVSGIGKRILVPLTSGYDSRLVLAATHYAGLKAETYTTGHDYISYADIKTPFKLSKAAGYRHMFIKPSAFSKHKEEMYDYHSGKNIYDIDRTKYAHGQWELFGKGDVVLRGGLFELARCFYWKKMGSELNIENIIEARRLTYDPDSFNAKALSEWLKWVKQTPTEGLDWRDRYYLEQRVAGWLSSLEQSLDLTDTERFYIINCHDIISLFLSIPEEKRKTSQHHIDLIDIMFHQLLRYPFNPPDPTFRMIQKKFTRLSKMPLNVLFRKLQAKFSR